MTRIWIVAMSSMAVLACSDDAPCGTGDLASSQSAVRRIGAEGGQLELASGAAVDVPRGALRDATQIEIERLDPSELRAHTGDFILLEDPVAVRPHGAEFEEPVELRLPRQRGSVGLNPERLDVLRLDDEDDTSFERVLREDVEYQDGAASLRLSRFSVYVIVLRDTDASTPGADNADSGAASGQDAGATDVDGGPPGNADAGRADSDADVPSDGGSGGGGDAQADAAADAGPGMCAEGFAECGGGDPADCETDITLVTSCGSCTNACNGTNGTASCEMGQCLISCQSGFGNCDTAADDGCETTLTGNDAHCGECGRDCAAAGTTCDVDTCAAVTVHDNAPMGSDNSGALTWAVGDGALFHTGYNGYTLRRLELSAATVSTRWSPASSSTAGRYSLVADDARVIWTQRGTPVVVLGKDHTAAAEDNPEVLWQPTYQPYHLMVHNNAYYWFSGDYQSGDPAAHIYTRATSAASDDAGSAIMTVDQGNHGNVQRFVAGTDALYWVLGAANAETQFEVWTCPLAGGTPTEVPIGPLTDNSNVIRHASIRTLGTTLFYDRDIGTSFLNGIWSWTPGETEGTQLVSIEPVLDFVLDGDVIYLTDGNNTYRAPITGGSAVQISGTGGDRILHQDETSLWVAKHTCCVTDIYRVIK